MNLRWQLKAGLALLCCLCQSVFSAAGQSSGQSSVPAQPAAESQRRRAAPAFDSWGDEFDGAGVDFEKWERFTFEGAGAVS